MPYGVADIAAVAYSPRHPPRRSRRRRRARAAGVVGSWRSRHYAIGRGRYRIFNAAEYRFYRSAIGPPAEEDEPFVTDANLPYTTTATFADGTWWVSCSYFNGVYDSGFPALGPNGETSIRLDIADGHQFIAPPHGPREWRLEALAGGVVRIIAVYAETGPERADEWAATYTTNGDTPEEDMMDVTAAIRSAGLAIWMHDLPAQAEATVVKVRLQTRRNDGTEETPDWVYSENSTVLTSVAIVDGPTAPVGAERGEPAAEM